MDESNEVQGHLKSELDHIHYTCSLLMNLYAADMQAEIVLEGRNIAGSLWGCNEDKMHESMLKLSNEFGFSSETYFQVSGLYL